MIRKAEDVCDADLPELSMAFGMAFLALVLIIAFLVAAATITPGTVEDRPETTTEERQ